MIFFFFFFFFEPKHVATRVFGIEKSIKKRIKQRNSVFLNFFLNFFSPLWLIKTDTVAEPFFFFFSRLKLFSKMRSVKD